MQLKYLNIKDHLHLENLEFSFTYPKGHEKEGKPLEKICFIGQSATGKSTILNLINKALTYVEKLHIVDQKHINDLLFLTKEIESNDFQFQHNGKQLIRENDRIVFGEQEYPIKNIGGSVISLLTDLKKIYFTTETISTNGNSILRTPVNTVINTENPNRKVDYKEYSFVLDNLINEKFWKEVLFEVIDYRKKFTQFASQLINNGDILELQKVTSKASDWKQKNPNPLEKHAKFFNKVLKPLNLEIDLVNTEFIVPIKAINGDNVIPFEGLSTGTKSLLLTMLPLIELNTDEAIILIDEPERSLFPDMQVEIMEHYQSIAPKAQFIIATHSPFIAASFEPCERFILYFNEKGKVEVRNGESPIGDDPNDMLYNDFKIDYYNKFGKEAYVKYRNLKQKVLHETDEKEKKKLTLEMVELGDKYNF